MAKPHSITGLEANFLLYCLDEYCAVDAQGKLTEPRHGYSLEALQDLRDRLFAIHEHPDEGNEPATWQEDDWDLDREGR